MGYDAGGLLRTETVDIRPVGGDNGNDTGGPASFSYDLAGRLTGWTSPFRIKQLDTTTSFTTDYVIDDGGNIDLEELRVEGELKRAIDPEYDANGRLRTRTVTDYGILNPADTTTSESFEYSGLGEEIERTSTSSAVGFADTVFTTATTYDPMGHTDSVDITGDSDKPRVDYTYASDNQLIGRLKGTDSTRLYFYWGTTQRLAEETDALGTTKVRYLLSSSGQVMAQQRPDAWTWLLRDPDANVATHLRDDGTLTAQRAYDPYGARNGGGTTKIQDDPTTVDKDESAESESTLGYQGAHTDDVTNNLLLGPRAYDPEVDRFTSPDYFVGAPADLALGTDPLTGNRYLFAAANPVAFYENGYEPCPKGGDCNYYYSGSSSRSSSAADFRRADSSSMSGYTPPATPYSGTNADPWRASFIGAGFEQGGEGATARAAAYIDGISVTFVYQYAQVMQLSPGSDHYYAEASYTFDQQLIYDVVQRAGGGYTRDIVLDVAICGRKACASLDAPKPLKCAGMECGRYPTMTFSGYPDISAIGTPRNIVAIAKVGPQPLLLQAPAYHRSDIPLRPDYSVSPYHRW